MTLCDLLLVMSRAVCRALARSASALKVEIQDISDDSRQSQLCQTCCSAHRTDRGPVGFPAGTGRHYRGPRSRRASRPRSGPAGRICSGWRRAEINKQSVYASSPSGTLYLLLSAVLPTLTAPTPCPKTAAATFRRTEGHLIRIQLRGSDVFNTVRVDFLRSNSGSPSWHSLPTVIRGTTLTRSGTLGTSPPIIASVSSVILPPIALRRPHVSRHVGNLHLHLLLFNLLVNLINSLWSGIFSPLPPSILLQLYHILHQEPHPGRGLLLFHKVVVPFW